MSKPLTSINHTNYGCISINTLASQVHDANDGGDMVKRTKIAN